MSLFSLTSLLFLAACNGDCDNCGDDGDGTDLDNEDCAECPDDTGDTGTTPTESATVTVEVTKLGEPVDTKVLLITADYFETGEVVATYSTSETFTVELGDEDFQVLVGSDDESDRSTDSYPIFTDDDGLDWVSPVQDLVLQDGDDVTLAFEENRYIGAELRCVEETYSYDEDAQDNYYQGEHRDTDPQDLMWYEVEGGHALNFNLDGNLDELEVNGYELSIDEERNDGGNVYIDGWIEDNGGFRSILTNTDYRSVYDWTCEL